MSAELTGVIAEHFAAINASDTDRIVATFADDAYVNDHRNVFEGITAIRDWIEREIVGDAVTIDVVDVRDHYGDAIVDGRYDGTYDKTNLPDDFVLTHYFSVRENKIVSLIIIFNQPLAE
ncbi:nuclear transport factor 2 family protein [Subtercola sp. YIM 133946]|uniref:nuclear transport factor 2 family protein n=1 Tax=Subtercola sp. YIM 133946 TaxID=3118909 RepID=UPI002F95109A